MTDRYRGPVEPGYHSHPGPYSARQVLLLAAFNAGAIAAVAVSFGAAAAAAWVIALLLGIVLGAAR